ncbi:MAG: SOS response-associated peptidase [Wenzhouxiangellaceae bacterium]|nr:SOS response-associated peptidase [Wenzhouxiangellaceae bacterium]
MCGRGGLDYRWETVWEWLDLAGGPPDGGVTRRNVAPGRRTADGQQLVRLPVVRPVDGQRGISELAWPLIPPWKHGRIPKFSTANCRSEPDRPFSEVVAGKPAFRHAWQRGQRCLVPMSWFYEWDKSQSPRAPWRVFPVDDPLLVMAGLWDRSKPDDGDPIESFTIVTTEPNALLRRIGHDRAPALLRPDRFDAWLTGSDAEAEAVLGPPPEGLLDAHRVTRRVNNPGYDEPDLLEEQAD